MLVANEHRLAEGSKVKTIPRPNVNMDGNMY